MVMVESDLSRLDFNFHENDKRQLSKVCHLHTQETNVLLQEVTLNNYKKLGYTHTHTHNHQNTQQPIRPSKFRNSAKSAIL